ncbi:MAG: hypothetical protein IT437_14040 [Phycisphaerales bacterium]|nr:hypothetical protein [Phycisphaerales bacterium]
MAVPLDDQPDQAITLRARAVRGQVEHYQPRVQRSEFDEFPSAEDIERFSGVTVTCGACGAVLHDDVAVCWQCGRAVTIDGAESGVPGPRRSRWLTTLTLILVVAMVATLIAWEAT